MCLVCQVPNTYIGMQSCIPAMMWWWCVGFANSYPDEVLGSTPQTWLSCLACSHVLCLTLSGAPKIVLYCTEYSRPTTLAPTDEASWAQWEKKPYRRKITLYWVEWSVPVVSLDTNNRKRKTFVRVETCQKNHFTFWLFVMLTHSSDLIFQIVFTLWIIIYIHVICSALNLWLFICIWMMSFLSRIWKDT